MDAWCTGPLQDRAQHYGVRSGLHQADLGGALPGRAQGHGALPMPSSWESSGGGAGGTKAELPELPNGAMPLQFGDWLYLCGPIMRDISNLAGRWWDLTVRQAQTYYQEWKALSPLQRVQLRPRLPNELFEACFARTEQRGVHMLLKAVSAEQQQELVVDRDLSSTAILFRLYIRHQPGGAGEKALLLGQLTSLQKATTMQELASSLRTWRRHFARAREVDASLPDGVLLLKALEMAVVMIAKEDAQASFWLSTSRQQLALDERPSEQSIWSFSQCLLAEAETLSLLKSSSTTSTNVGTPVKLKQIDAGMLALKRCRSMELLAVVENLAKGQSTPMADQPCNVLPAATQAAKLAKIANGLTLGTVWRTRTTGAGSVPAKITEKTTARSRAMANLLLATLVWGEEEVDKMPMPKRLSKMLQFLATEASDVSKTMATVEQTFSSTNKDGPALGAESNSQDSLSSATVEVEKGGAPATNAGATELLAEATQLLKSLRMPNMKVMQLSKLEPNAQVLLDSGATHGLRPAASQEEWNSAEANPGDVSRWSH